MVRGIVLKILSTIAFTLMATCVKLIGVGHPGDPFFFPVGQTVFCRSLFALIPVFIWLGYQGELRAAFAGADIRAHARRGFFGSVGMFSGFTALLLLPLADATAISYAAPLFTVALAALILKEKVRIYRWSAVGVGFVGVVLMLVPYLGTGSGTSQSSFAGAMLGLLGAVCSAFATIETRKLTETQSIGAIVSYFMLLTTLIGLATLGLGFVDASQMWKWPGARDAFLLVMMGVMGGIGQITMTMSFRLADASVIAPFDYISMVWAILIGWFVFSQLPEPVVFAGAIIVVLSGLFVIYRERQLGLDRTRQRSSAPPRSL